MLGSVKMPVSVETMSFERLPSTELHDFLHSAAPVRCLCGVGGTGEGMGWRLWVSAAVLPAKGQGPQTSTGTQLPVPTCGGGVPEPFPHRPHNFRTSSLRGSLKDNEVGFTVTFSPLQQVERRRIIIAENRVNESKAAFKPPSKAHCLWS